MRAPKVLLVGLCALPFLLTACDDDDDGGSSEDEAQITAAINAAAVSGDPAACTTAQTQAFTEQITGETGDAAIKQCEDDADDPAGDAVEISEIEVDGDSATANALFTGQIFDGQTIALGLVKEGDAWKVDEATGFVDFDQDAFVAAFKSELAQEQDVPAGAVDCIAGNLQGLSDEQAEQLFLNSDAQLESQVFDPCFNG